ncbi:MAG TPA: PDZ domain-containing protein [Lacipirellulaceae bacterium]
MKKATYGLGLLASVLFAAAIADAQTSGGGSSSGASGASASGSSATGTSTTGSTGTTAAGSSGVGASSPSNLVTGGAGSSSTTGTAAGRTGTGASAFQASPPGSAVTQPGLPGTRQTNPALQGSTFDRRSGLNQQNTLNQTDFTQRSAIERQRLIDQQQSATLRTQQGQFDQGQSRISNQQMIDQRAGLGEQQAAGRQDDLRDQSMLRGETDLRSEQTLAAGTAPGELGVFVSDGATRGVLVSRVVTGSAAATAGLQPGDIIVGVGDQMINSPVDLTRFIRAIRAGEVAQLQVLRGGAEYDVDATLLPFRGGQSSSYGVGYRGSESAVSGDLSSRVRRLEEQLAMVLDELQSIRRDVVALRGGSSEATGFDARFRAGETRTGAETQGSATRDESSTEFDQRSTQSGFGTDVNDRGPVSGVDARSDTAIDARSTQPTTEQRDDAATRSDASDRGTTPPSTDNDPFGLDSTQPDATQQNEQPASNNEEQESQTESDPALPF